MAEPRSMLEFRDLPLPDLPPRLEGLRIAHLSDLHVTRPRRRFDAAAAQLQARRLDLVLFTGDYMSGLSARPAVMACLVSLCKVMRPALGFFGVFGNHDTGDLRTAARALPIRWVDNDAVAVADHPIDIIGVGAAYEGGYDAAAAALALAKCPSQGRRLRLLLSHYPDFLPMASDLGADIMFAGHTHGGQVRLPGGRALMNHSDLPLAMSAGLLRHRQTLCSITRGMGEVGVPLRLNCPPQLPVFTLRRGPLPGRETDTVVAVETW